MPYQGKSVSLTEMLDVLVGRGRSEADAALELERAFEDRAIALFAPDESGHDGTVWRALSADETAAIIGLLRDLPNRARIPTIRYWNAPITLFGAARAARLEFERACKLSANEDVAPIPPNRRIVTDDVLVQEAVEGIREGRWPNARQAAIALQSRAEGNSPESTIDRLRTKIRNAMN